MAVGPEPKKEPGKGTGNPVILCLPGRGAGRELEALVQRLRRSGREVIVATRPLSRHLTGRRCSCLERLTARLGADRIHWVSVGDSCAESYDTLSAMEGLASVTLVEPELPDSEPSHPGRGRVPKLVIEKGKGRRGRRPGAPGRYLGNTLGPVEVKVLPPEKEEDLPRVVLEFLDRADREER